MIVFAGTAIMIAYEMASAAHGPGNDRRLAFLVTTVPVGNV